MKSHWYLLALLFPALALAQDFERMDFVMDELDMETGSCLPKYKQALTRITQLTNTATKAKKQLRQCRNKLNDQPKVVTKNIDPNPQLLEQVSQLSTSVAASQRENTRLKQSITQLKSQLAAALTNKASPATAKPLPTAAPIVSPLPTSTEEKKLKLYSATSSSHARNYPAKGLIDGKPNKNLGRAWWSKSNNIEDQYVNIVLTKAQTISKVRIHIPERNNNNGIDHVILTFSDGSNQRIQLSREWGWQTLEINPTITETVKINFYLVSENIRARKNHIIINEIELLGY